MQSQLSVEYNNLSKELFSPSVICTGVSDVNTNFNDMLIFNWNTLTLNTIKQYPSIYKQFTAKIKTQPTYLGKIHVKNIIYNIQSFLQENYEFIKKIIINGWVTIYRNKLKLMYNEYMFHDDWYGDNTKNVTTRLDNIKSITSKISNYSLLHGYHHIKPL